MRDTILYDSALRLFGDHVSPRVLEAAVSGEWPAALWLAVEEAGYLDVLADGLGGMVEAVAILRAAGHHAAPIPLPETMLARWLCAASGIDAPDGPLSIALEEPGDPGDTGRCRGAASPRLSRLFPGLRCASPAVTGCALNPASASRASRGTW